MLYNIMQLYIVVTAFCESTEIYIVWTFSFFCSTSSYAAMHHDVILQVYALLCFCVSAYQLTLSWHYTLYSIWMRHLRLCDKHVFDIYIYIYVPYCTATCLSHIVRLHYPMLCYAMLLCSTVLCGVCMCACAVRCCAVCCVFWCVVKTNVLCFYS